MTETRGTPEYSITAALYNDAVRRLGLILLGLALTACASGRTLPSIPAESVDYRAERWLELSLARRTLIEHRNEVISGIDRFEALFATYTSQEQEAAEARTAKAALHGALLGRSETALPASASRIESVSRALKRVNDTLMVAIAFLDRFAALASSSASAGELTALQDDEERVHASLREALNDLLLAISTLEHEICTIEEYLLARGAATLPPEEWCGE